MSATLTWGRRAGLLGILAGILVITSPGPSSAQLPPRQLSATEAASHVLNRLAFGPRPGQVEDVAQNGWRRWVERQLNPDAVDDSLLERRIAECSPTLQLSLTELQQLGKEDKGKKRESRREVKDELREAVLRRAVSSTRQFKEVMVEFWRNHLNVDVNKVPFLASHYEEHVLRQHAFGKFEDLLLASAKHPAMLVYLDNYISNRSGVNENYARELMELHTLGVDNGYTQKDVVALARVLTGWTCGWRTGPSGSQEYMFYFNEGAHDTSPATVVGLDLAGTGGMADGEKAIRHLANHSGTARFLAIKLCRYLVNDVPSPELVDRVVSTFHKTGGDLREIYRTILFSPEFMDPRNYRAKFKTPFEYTVSALRTVSARIESPDEIFRELRLMGQPIYECEEPTGFSDQREAWLDPGIMVYRWNLAIGLVTDKVKGVKIGRGFTDEVVKSTHAARTRQVMAMVLPGIQDPATERFIARSTDLRTQVALALGSPGFQQQ